MPALFVSHGSPMTIIEQTEGHFFLKELGTLVPRPKAILSVTAHWVSPHTAVSSDPQPETIHDFGGFPQELFDMQYPAPGAPEVAAAALKLLRDAGIDAVEVPKRGFDHGTWSPLILSYPDADIPVVQMAVQPRENAAWHYKLGRALEPLRDQGVMILGSGSISHNLRSYFNAEYAETPAWVTDFTDWVADSVREKKVDELLDYLHAAPAPTINHPTSEHWLPFYVALGAAGEAGTGTRIHESIDRVILAMDAYRFD